MSSPYLGEIRMFAGNFAPAGWALCNGQTLSISTNTALFSLLGTNFGGNGTTTFNLPNLQATFPIHWGSGPAFSGGYVGLTGGSASIALSALNLPSHNHPLNCVASGGNQPSPTGALPAIESTGTSSNYSSSAATGQMNSGAIGSTGAGEAFSPVPPFLCVTFIIALEGIFPSRN
ncbi:MAG TPA: tail fiber protein [Candidatus Saccharimonadales bacterium]|nr:tail fiber protein [Candidatus Saccharimonadales bacterium]